MMPACDVCSDKTGSHRMWCSEGGDPGLTLDRARSLVIADQRQSFPDLDDFGAIDRALDVSYLPWMGYAPAATEVTDEGSEVARAYMTLHLHDKGKWSET